MFVKRVLVAVLTLQIIFPASIYAQQQLPRPTDRWRATSAGSLVSDVPLIEGSALPQLEDNGIKSGEAGFDYSDDGRSLIVDQQSAKLLAYWKNFNIGKSNSVEYHQPDSNSLAVNIINQQSPSQILGSLSCNGACWLLNPNGVIFGAESTVDTRGLIAAAMEFNGLPMDGNLSAEQLAQFEDDPIFDAINRGTGEALLVNAKDIAEGTDGLPMIRLMQQTDENGDVVSRASINSDSAPVLLAAPVVVNEGDINSDGGQVVLAGSRKDVYLALTNPKESNYRGYLIEVDSGNRTDGERGAVINAGALTANLGNVTLVASDIVQAGVIKSSTAVDVNGSIRILARDRAIPKASTSISSTSGEFKALYFDEDTSEYDQIPTSINTAVGLEAGVVTLADNSSMEISIESSPKADMANDGLAQLKSHVAIEGREVVMGKGASIVAPSGEVSIRARENPVALLENPEDTNAYFSMGEGALIDVSGTEEAVLGVERNLVDVFVTSNELRDASAQKGGPLLRQDLVIDIRKGTPLFDWTVALDSVDKSALERNATGGNVTILAKGNVSLDDKAVIDISGGKVKYEAGFLETTRLMTSNGIVDISEADPSVPYLGVLNGQFGNDVDAKWGESSWFRPTPTSLRYYRAEYYEGFDAGSLAITTPRQQVADSVRIKADTTVGRYQRGNASTPVGGDLNFQFKGPTSKGADIYIVSEADNIADQLANQESHITESLLEDSGAANITINNQLGIVYQDVNVDLNFDQDANLDITGTGIYIFGDIRTTGGDVSLKQDVFIPDGNNARDIEGYMHLTGLINTSGNWTNDNPELGNALPTPLIDAGDIDLSAIGDLNITDSAGFYANAGAWAKADGSLKIGSAGDIALIAKRGDNIPAVLSVDPAVKFVALDNKSGGKLTIASKTVALSGDADTSISETLQINNNFFDTTDVGAYQFIALDGNVTVASSADIDLSHQSLIARDIYSTLKSSNDASRVLQQQDVPDYVAGSGSLSLEAQRLSTTSSDEGVLVVEHGSTITGPAGSKVELLANNRILVDGDIQITGGGLQVAISQTAGEDGSRDNYILIGENANLDFSAGAIAIPSNSVETSKVLVDAGSVSLNALFGYALVSEDANIRLAGAMVNNTNTVYSGRNLQGSLQTVATPLAAGSFTVAAERGFSVAAEIDFGETGLGYAGGQQNYMLSSDLSYQRLDGRQESTNNKGFNYVAHNLEILLGADPVAAQIAFGELIDTSYVGKGMIATGNLNGDHVAQLTINTDNTKTNDTGLTLNKVSAEGDVILAANSSVVLATPMLDLNTGATPGQLTVIAPHVQLGEDKSRDVARQSAATPVDGAGTLDIQTQLLDLAGNIAISGANTIDVAATEGVRARVKALGVSTLTPSLMQTSLKTAADLTIETPLLWGDTLADQHFDLIGEDSVFTLIGARTDQALLSVGANLLVSAKDIVIDGAIAAPFGSIALEGNNSVTLGEHAQLDVSGSGSAPFGRVQVDGVAWVYELNTIGEPLVFDSLPEKSISIKAASLDTAEGSVLDLSGGGTVYGREFIAGLGGSTDVLKDLPYTKGFVIVPGQRSGFSPYDFLEFSGSNIPWGTNFEVSGSDQIADGIYTVLPANYALLPGAIFVTPVNNSAVVGAGYHANNQEGAEITAGRFNRVGSLAQEMWSSFRIEQGSIAQQRSEFRINSADDLLLAGSPGSRPEENGRLIINASESLQFSGTVTASEQSAVGVSFDLLSDQNIVVGESASVDGLAVSPGIFESLAADSILIGGERVWQDGAWLVTPVADTVSFDNVQFSAQELVVTAKDQVEFTNNSEIASTAAPSFSGNRWTVSDDGALLLMSTTAGSRLDLGAVTSPGSALSISADSRLESSGAIGVVYDGVDSLERLAFVGDGDTRLQIASDNVLIGNVAEGAVVDGQLLQAAKLTEIKASDSIQFNQSVNAELTQAELRTGTIIVADTAEVSLSATDTILLETTADASSHDPLASAGTLYLAAPNVVIASKDADQSNSNSLDIIAQLLDIRADSGLFVAGNNQLNSSGDIAVTAPTIAAIDNSNFSMVSAENISLNSDENGGQLSGDYAPAAIFNFVANKELTVDTAVSAQSGAIQLQSETASIHIGEQSRLDVAAYSKQFIDQTLTAPAGIISASAYQDIEVADSSSFIFGDAQQDGSGGLLELIAGNELDMTNAAGPGQWSRGGVDLNIQANRLTQGFTPLLDLTGNGFDGNVAVLLKGDGEAINISSEQQLDVASLDLATLQGTLTLDGTIAVDNSQDSHLHAGKGVVLGDTATLSMQNRGGDASQSADVIISSDTGGVQIAEAGSLLIDGGLTIIKDLADTLTDVIVDASDSITGALSLVLADSSEQSSVTQTGLKTAADALIAQVDATAAGDFITAEQGVDVLPMLDIYSTSDLSVGSLELDDWLTLAGNPGLLQLRAAGDLNINGGIDAALQLVDALGTEVLMNHKSWGVSLVSGADITSRYQAINQFAGAGDLTISNGAYVQTGTGDIHVLSRGDVNLTGSAFIATMGQAEYGVEPPNVDGFLEGEILPVWGDRGYIALWYLMPGSGGFGTNSGDITINAMGNMNGGGVSQTPAEFINRLSYDDYVSEFFLSSYHDMLDTDKVRTWLLAPREISGGIHAIAGGDVRVLAKGNIENIGFSTPSIGEGYTHDYQVSEIYGGKLSVESFRSIYSSSFANNGASINVRALGAISNASGRDGASLFMGSDTQINAVAGGDFIVDAVANQFSIPTLESLYGWSTGSAFVYGFNTTSANLQSIAGDLKRTNASEAVQYFLPESQFATLYKVKSGTDTTTRDLRFRLLPSNVTLTALQGNVVLAQPGKQIETTDSLFLFPDPAASLSLYAGSSILAGSDELTVRIPDLNASVVAGIRDTYSLVLGDFISDSLAGDNSKILTALSNPTKFHSDNLIRRDAAETAQIIALNGNIGDGDDILFEMPVPVKAYAGGDIVNTSFEIQHSNFGAISQIVAEGDIVFPIALAASGKLEDGDYKAIRVAGPGDLIVSAGGTVDLGTIEGIETVGNQNNSNLPAGGASVHVYAGFNGVGDYRALIGNGVESNVQIAALRGLGSSEESVNSLSLLDWFSLSLEKPSTQSQHTQVLLKNIRRASGVEKYSSVDAALDDWNAMELPLRLRIAVSAMKELALENPEFIVAHGDILFANPSLGEAGFASPQQRQEVFERYWNGIGSLIALEYLLTPDRQTDFSNSLTDGTDLAAFALLPVSEQLNTAVSTFNTVDSTTQMLIAEQIMLDHTKQGGREGFESGNALLNFERGYVAQRMFFGADYDKALAGIVDKVAAIQSGQITAPGSVNFGKRDGVTLNSVEAVFEAWGLSSGIEFLFDENAATQPAGEISLVFSTVRSLAGGDISLLAPGGSVDVGLAIAQLDELGIVDLDPEASDPGKRENQLGVLALGLGDVNGVVANAYNVNQSRSFSLAGGDMNLWSSFGDIDAGRGAKTSFVSPPTEFQISADTGQITLVRPPAFAGSGIRTSESRSGSSKELNDTERFYLLADGAGGTYLATALGIVDAGEAGIESAGDLFIAAAEVRGADNINVGGVSVGVATDTTISGSVASVGNAANAATESAQSAATSGVSGTEEDVTAFVTIELLDTGT